MSRLRIALARILPILALSVVLGLLVGESSLLRLLPFPWTFAFTLIAMGAVLFSLTPALLSMRTPLPAAIGVVVPVLMVASYDQSRLDWLRTLKDFGVATPGEPAYLRLGLALLALLLLWTLHAVDTALRLRWSAQDRGVPNAQARDAARVSLARSALLALYATLGVAGIGALAYAAARLDVDALFGGRAAVVAPLLAIALIAGAAVLLARRGGDDANEKQA